MSTIHRNTDCTDEETVWEFMKLGKAIVNSPQELLSMGDTSKLALAISAMVSSGFCDHYPHYYGDYEMELVICATGFYAIKKAIKSETFPRSFYPSFVVLLHYGERHLAELVECAALWNPNGNNPNDPQFRRKYDRMEEKKESIVAAFKLAYINYCKSIGCGEGLDEFWKATNPEYIRECMADLVMRSILESSGSSNYEVCACVDIFKYEERLYNYIENNLKSSHPFEFGF